VVGADGHSSSIASLVGAAIQEEVAPARAMYYRYIEGLDGPEGAPDGPEFSLEDDELLYVFPSDAGTACVAISSTSLDTRGCTASRPSHSPSDWGRTPSSRRDSVLVTGSVASGDAARVLLW
jgi:hypothetical protein